MTVDIHAHVLPSLVVEVSSNEETRWGVDFGRGDDGRVVFRHQGSWSPLLQTNDVYRETAQERAARLRRIRVDVQVLSLSPSLYLQPKTQRDAVGMCTELNDAVADYVADEPGTFRALAVLPLEHPEAAVAEMERSKAIPGFVGVVVPTHVNGRDWDDPHLLPVLDAAEATSTAVFVHPAAVRATDLLSRHHLRNLVGNPLETTLAIASLTLGGVLDRFPALRLCFAHGGGYGVLGVGRWDHGHRVRPELGSGPAPSELLGGMWFDSLTHDEAALRHIADRLGAERILLGSDDPADMGLADPVAWLESCDTLTLEEREKILEVNAAAFLGRPID